MERHAAARSAVYFENLDALRFLAFFLVFLRHGFGDLARRVDAGSYCGSLIKDGLFNSGDVGVAFFFVLSGFLITYLILKEIETRGCLDARAFYIRRCLRIWPLYYAVVAIGCSWFPAGSGSPAHQVKEPMPSPMYYLTFQGNLVQGAARVRT